MKTTRRDFLKLGGVSLGATAIAPRLGAAESMPATPGTVSERARQVPIAGEADVIVCGAGPAGVSASVAAARKGARVLLLETQGCLGGIWTVGLLSWILDHQNKPGLMRELLERLAKADGRTLSRRGVPTNAYDAEVMKITREELCAQATVQIQLHTRVCAALKDSQNRLTHVITESKSGREAFAGKVFVDCTGDGDLGALAGCGFDFGHPEAGRTPPMTLMALVTGIRPEEVAALFRDGDKSDWVKPKDALRAEMERGGRSPSYAKPTFFRIRDDLFALMANHDYDGRGTSARDVISNTCRRPRNDSMSNIFTRILVSLLALLNHAASAAEPPATTSTYDQRVAMVTKTPSCVAFWDFVKRESGGARRFVAHVPADSPAELLDASWQGFAMTYNHERHEVTGWLNGKDTGRWQENVQQAIPVIHNAWVQGHLHRKPGLKTGEDANFLKDQFYNPPEDKPVGVKVLSETVDERLELQEFGYTRVRVIQRKEADGIWTTTARDLADVRLNPWWYPHDSLYTPAKDGTGGPFTIGHVIHSSRSVGFTGWIGGVAVFDRALNAGEMAKLSAISRQAPTTAAK